MLKKSIYGIKQARKARGKKYMFKRSLYGLKQARRAWYNITDEYLYKLGFVKSPSEATLYVKRTYTNWTIVSIYFDDLLVIKNDEKLIEKFKAEMLKNLRWQTLVWWFMF